MLNRITVKNIVLIDKLVLDFNNGLCALTGETGAGKSILLDSMSLSLGMRADTKLIRHGTDNASVTAEFSVRPNHPAYQILEEQGMTFEDEPLILRRCLTSDGRSRAFINDQAVSISLLKKIGAQLVEIHGQFDTSSLLDAKHHGEILDKFGHLQNDVTALKSLYHAWHDAREKFQIAQDTIAQDKADEEYLRHLVEELDQLAVEPNEEEHLSTIRSRLMHREKIIEALNAAHLILSGDEGIESQMSDIQGPLSRIAEHADEKLTALIETIDRIGLDITDVISQINSQSNQFTHEDINPNEIEERLFALKDCARKHHCSIDELPNKQTELHQKLSMIENQETSLKELELQVTQTQDKYLKKARLLSQKRHQAAQKLDQAVIAELPPLKLEKALFLSQIKTSEDEKSFKESGIDRVQFLVSTNPGSAPGPIHKVASGGELARFMLALKVNLSASSTIPSLVFDEVDSGVGGATADAVGERLALLAQDVQILVVTHSPQVAARANHHWMVSKAQNDDQNGTTTTVIALDNNQRLEEIARMLSGSKITSEARAAAAKLMETPKNAA